MELSGYFVLAELPIREDGQTLGGGGGQPGQWVLHCHNIYHAESGMLTVLSKTLSRPADVRPLAIIAARPSTRFSGQHPTRRRAKAICL